MDERIEDRIKDIIVERLFLKMEASAIPDDEPLTDACGIDSVRLFEVVIGLEETFGISFADDEFTPEAFRSVATIASAVRAKADDSS